MKKTPNQNEARDGRWVKGSKLAKLVKKYPLHKSPDWEGSSGRWNVLCMPKVIRPYAVLILSEDERHGKAFRFQFRRKCYWDKFWKMIERTAKACQREENDQD